MDRRNNWSYQPPHPPVSNEQQKPQHFQPFDKAYPKTLESLAEKVHPFCPGGQSSTGRRMSATTTQQQYRRNNMPRSGSDQYLPRSEYDYGSSELKINIVKHLKVKTSIKIKYTNKINIICTQIEQLFNGTLYIMHFLKTRKIFIQKCFYLVYFILFFLNKFKKSYVDFKLL